MQHRLCYADPARPIPGCCMPSSRDIEQEVSSSDFQKGCALGPNDPAFRLAHQFLIDFGYEPLARHLENKIDRGEVVCGEFTGFLAATVEKDGREWILLSNRYEAYNSDDQRAASLVHEIGALKHFAPLFLDHFENERREKLFLEVQKAQQRVRSLIVQWSQSGGAFAEREIPVILDDHSTWKPAAYIDAKLSHHLELRHRTANAVVILPNERVVLLHRAARRQAEPSTLSIVGGHLHAGSGFFETILNQELPKELGMPPGY